MEPAFWDQVAARGHAVPDDRPLAELTAELTAMLGDTDPHRRLEIAVPTLLAWVRDGTYDELLEGLGDGMAAGLSVGLGDRGTPTVLRRGASARVLTACLDRDSDQRLVPAATVLGWGDRIAGWLVREEDLRETVATSGAAAAVVAGADALAALARSPALGRLELTVVLDVVADRLLAPTGLGPGPAVDHLALAVVEVLRRDLVGPDVVERWVARVAAGAAPASATNRGDGRTAQAFLRALHLLLALGRRPPASRADVLLTVIEHLRALEGGLLT